MRLRKAFLHRHKRILVPQHMPGNLASAPALGALERLQIGAMQDHFFGPRATTITPLGAEDFIAG